MHTCSSYFNHEAIIFNLRLAKLLSTSKTISYRNLAKLNTEEVLADLKKLELTHDPPSQLSKAISLYNLELSQLLDQTSYCGSRCEVHSVYHCLE